MTTVLRVTNFLCFSGNWRWKRKSNCKRYQNCEIKIVFGSLIAVTSENNVWIRLFLQLNCISGFRARPTTMMILLLCLSFLTPSLTSITLDCKEKKIKVKIAFCSRAKFVSWSTKLKRFFYKFDAAYVSRDW